MDIWSYTIEGYNMEETVTNGNRFLIGNGYMGYRGTMDEWGRDELAAVNLAGVYDQNGNKWREPVNAPNGLFAKLFFNGKPISLGETSSKRHSQTVHFNDGLHCRNTDFGNVRIQGERFASMAEPHLLVSRLTLTFRESGSVELLTGVVTDIWDINGPHLFDFTYQSGEILLVKARTGELSIPVAVAQAAFCDFPYEEKTEENDNGIFRRICFDADTDVAYTVTLVSTVYTGLDDPEPGKRVVSLCKTARTAGFDVLYNEHNMKWKSIWQYSHVELQGCDEAAHALNASLYHLHSIAPRHAASLSIPARGLSGQTYKGAIFWDSEMFLFPFFAHTEPEMAKSLLRYRIDTLPGALKKAAEYGFRGAFYPWESQEGGTEGCTNYNVTDVFTHRPVRTYFRDKQIHISGDVAYAFWRYYEITGDIGLFLEGGAEVVLQCARFYLSRSHRRIDRDKVELLDVIGPDEYHERVNNNAFTNMMASNCLSCVLALTEVLVNATPGFMDELVKKLDYADDLILLRDIASKLRPIFTDGEVIEQFDGYFLLEDCTVDDVRSRLLDDKEYWGTNHGVAAHTQVIKQADVIAMMALFPELFSIEMIERNWRYYEPRTEHGSSLSSCMYALTACRFGKPELAWEHFLKTASIDIKGGGKHWAGEIYIGGTHPAANGGAWMIAVLGFAGLSLKGGEISLAPCLPSQVQSLSFPVAGRRVIVTHDGWKVENNND